MNLHISVAITPNDKVDEGFYVDRCQPLKVDLHLTQSEIHKLLLGELFSMASEAAWAFSEQENLRTVATDTARSKP